MASHVIAAKRIGRKNAQETQKGFKNLAQRRQGTVVGIAGDARFALTEWHGEQ